VTEDVAIEAARFLLENTGDYRVLKRFPKASSFDALVADALVGVAVDVETTGLDVEIDEVIELGMIKFLFDREGHVGQIISTFQSFNQPNVAIPKIISDLTGIHAHDVRGQRISGNDVETFLADATLIIAHNAAFDRPFCEALVPAFIDLPWACSATEIPWRSEGITGTRLEYIAHSFGRFYDPHRAIDDCNAVVHILSLTLPRSNTPVLSALLQNARRIDMRVFADGAPYDSRIELKRRGYRWNDGQNGYPRAWWKDIPIDDVDKELASLEAIKNGKALTPNLFRMTAKTRFRRQV
jgi:DNA polymerase-3 subunit epsilon